MDDTRPLDARQWLKLAAALFVLNAALTLQNVWPTLWVRLRPEVSIELGVLLLVLVVWTSFVAPLGRKTLAGLTVLMLVLLIGRYAEVTSPALYGRPVNLYWDSQHLPNVAAMLAERRALVARRLARARERGAADGARLGSSVVPRDGDGVAALDDRPARARRYRGTARRRVRDRSAVRRVSCAIAIRCRSWRPFCSKRGLPSTRSRPIRIATCRACRCRSPTSGGSPVTTCC